jgi:hypothetical protein
MQINYEDFYKVAPDDVVELIKKIASGEAITSVRGETVKTHKEISRETAVAGVSDA